MVGLNGRPFLGCGGPCPVCLEPIFCKDRFFFQILCTVAHPTRFTPNHFYSNSSQTVSKTKRRAILGVWGVTACQSGPLVPLGSSFVQIKDDKDNDDEEDEDKEDCQSGPLGSVGSSFVQIDILATLPFCWPTRWHMLEPNNPTKFNM